MAPEIVEVEIREARRPRCPAPLPAHMVPAVRAAERARQNPLTRIRGQVLLENTLCFAIQDWPAPTDWSTPRLVPSGDKIDSPSLIHPQLTYTHVNSRVPLVNLLRVI
jgi:hypothetical protein